MYRLVLLLLASCYFTAAVAAGGVSGGYSYEQGPVLGEQRAPCPGLYCGRSPLNDTHVSQCGPCPRGWRVTNHTHSLCAKCEDSPDLTDWLFLLFHALFVLVLHWVSIDLATKRRSFTNEVLVLHLCALVEVVVAAAVTLLVSEPAGSLDLVTCRGDGVGKRLLSDWYSFFHNPSPNYEETLHCTHEVVYPLFTLVFTFYAFCVLTMLLLRPCASRRQQQPRRRSRSSVYAALYFLPALAVVHATCGGLVYMAYPYIVFVLSVISSAAHFAFKLDQSARALLLGCFRDGRNFVILFGHWLLHAFGILAITQLKSPVLHASLLALVPLPALFYVATARFTDPVNFSTEMTN